MIALLAISIVASATCYFNWQCTDCGKFTQTSEYNCNGFMMKPTPGHCSAKGSSSFMGHSWVMTGYFER